MEDNPILAAMTVYEALDLGRSHVNGATDDLNRALALGSAYLIAAYRVGKELTTLQVSIINFGFFVFVIQALFGVYGEVQSHHNFVLAVVDAERAEQLQAFWMIEGPLMGTAAIMGVLACFVFMWSVRHPKAE